MYEDRTMTSWIHYLSAFGNLSVPGAPLHRYCNSLRSIGSGLFDALTEECTLVGCRLYLQSAVPLYKIGNRIRKFPSDG